jgi:hypothetical protein
MLRLKRGCPTSSSTASCSTTRSPPPRRNRESTRGKARIPTRRLFGEVTFRTRQHQTQGATLDRALTQSGATSGSRHGRALARSGAWSRVGALGGSCGWPHRRLDRMRPEERGVHDHAAAVGPPTSAADPARVPDQGSRSDTPQEVPLTVGVPGPSGCAGDARHPSPPCDSSGLQDRPPTEADRRPRRHRRLAPGSGPPHGGVPIKSPCRTARGRR